MEDHRLQLAASFQEEVELLQILEVEVGEEVLLKLEALPFQEGEVLLPEVEECPFLEVVVFPFLVVEECCLQVVRL